MSALPSWTFEGTVPIQDDLSALEAALHSGRVSAAERGYQGEPDSIDTEEVMRLNPGDEPPVFAGADEVTDRDFVPTALRFRMHWAAEPA
jgi:hypothetical protein